MEWVKYYDPQKDRSHIFLKLCEQRYNENLDPLYEQLWNNLLEKCKVLPCFITPGFAKTLKANHVHRAIALLPYVDLDQMDYSAWKNTLCYKDEKLWEVLSKRLPLFPLEHLFEVFVDMLNDADLEKIKIVVSHLKVRSNSDQLIQDWARSSSAQSHFFYKTVEIFTQLEDEIYFSEMIDKWITKKLSWHRIIVLDKQNPKYALYLQYMKSWIRKGHVKKEGDVDDNLMILLFKEIEREMLQQEVSWANLPSNGNIVRL